MANVGIYDMTDTWNNAGTAFTAIKMNVTDTASAAGSKLLDVQIGGSSYLELNKSGELGILDKIFHLGDTNTAIRFPSADTVTVETTGTERMRIDSSGNVLVGTTTATNNVRLAQKFGVVGAGTNIYPGLSVTGYVGTSSNYATLIDFQRSRGTSDGDMTAVASGDPIYFITGRGSDGTNFVNSSIIAGVVDGTVSTNQVPGRLEFSTANSSGTMTERMRIDSDGYLRMASGSGGIQFNGDTSGFNALNDYELGAVTVTLTPTTSGSTSLYAAENALSYTKIGQLVHLQGRVTTAGVSSPVGNITISPLPFTIASLADSSGFALGNGWLQQAPGTAVITGSEGGTSVTWRIDASTITSDDNIYISFTYISV